MIARVGEESAQEEERKKKRETEESLSRPAIQGSPEKSLLEDILATFGREGEVVPRRDAGRLSGLYRSARIIPLGTSRGRTSQR